MVILPHGIPVAPGQPVVGLDFDGVLNVAGGAVVPEGYEAHTVELDRARWPEHPYIRPLPPGGSPAMLGVVTSRGHGGMVRSWLDAGAVVVWATTWERAVLRNAALCDIPELPVLEISRVLPDHFPMRTAQWKLDGLLASFPGHPLVWVDDFGDQVDPRDSHGDPPVPMLIVAPDGRVGLTAEQSDRIVEFIRRTR